MKRLGSIIIVFLVTAASAQKPPDQVYQKLFYDVQLSGIFPDSKTFVDCIPKRSSQTILREYLRSGINKNDTARLRKFVFQNFLPPYSAGIEFQSSEQDISLHIRELWNYLEREKDKTVPGSSLLPLPYQYIVPGGRFREIYYWDSYFTMLGLKESGEIVLMENMVKNFAYLVGKYGLIPNGNRTYYLSRSQPPFFSLMVELLAEIQGKKVVKKFHPLLQKELSYWKKENLTTLKDGIKVFYYHDRQSIPRQESYKEDILTTQSAFENAIHINPFLNKDSFTIRTYQHLRAAAASGWDFSSRWFRDSTDIKTIRTADIIPVDLNCLLFHLDFMVNSIKPKSRAKQKEARMVEIKKVFFNDSLGWYCDYDRLTGKPLNIPTLAGMYPLFMGLADKKEVPRIVNFLEKNFLKPGGVVTTITHSGQQWDAPNGWAPLQWITIIGLENYGYHELAKKIAERWCGLNMNVFKKTGRLMEKYNVIDMELEAGGGEYPSQDGFGWTNGVLLALLNKYGIR